MNTNAHYLDAQDLIDGHINTKDSMQEVDDDLRKLLNEVNVKLGLPVVTTNKDAAITTFEGVLRDLEASVKPFETPTTNTLNTQTAIASASTSDSMLDVTPPITPLPSASELFKDIIKKRERALPKSRRSKRKRQETAPAQTSSRGQPPPYPGGEAPSAEEPVKPSSPTVPAQNAARSSLQRKIFTNVPNFPTPYIPVDYVINIDVYPSRACGTLYEKLGKSTCAKVDIEDPQVLKVFQLDEKKGLGLVARYITQALTSTVLLHNKIFNYVVDVDRIPISVRTYTGVVHNI